MSDYDAVIVGARCAGAPLALQLARGGWRALMIDREAFGSDTLSTHFVFPNTLDRLESLGILGHLRKHHDLSPLEYRARILDHEIMGTFTPIGGFDYAVGPRRVVLDKACVEVAQAAGAEARFEERVTGLLGAGTEADPVRGVVLADGEEVRARWVFGADGRASKVAGLLGLEKHEPRAGEMAMLLAYWTGLPPSVYMHLHAEADFGLTFGTCEDGVALVVAFGRAPFTAGDADVRERRYLETIRRFPHTLDPEWLEDAERVTEVRAAPESMLRGFYRRACGPGWALVGDAGHFKHPATAQGISDAVEQAMYVADAMIERDEDLGGYEAWRNARAEPHYDWSFQFAMFPRPEVAGPIFGGLASDAAASQEFIDSMSRIVEPRQALSPERLGRWFAAAA